MSTTMAQYHQYTTFKNPKDIMRDLMAIVNTNSSDSHLSISCARQISDLLGSTLRKSTLPQNPVHRARSRSRSPPRKRDGRLEAPRSRREERQQDYEHQLERDRETNLRAGERMREAQARYKENPRSRQQSALTTATSRAPVQLYSKSAPSNRFHGPVDFVHSFYAPAGSNLLPDEGPLQFSRYRLETKTGQSIRTRPSDGGPPQGVDTTFYWEFDSPDFPALLPDYDPTTDVASAPVEQPSETVPINGESAGTATAEETDESTEPPTHRPASPSSLDVNISTPHHSFTAVEEQDSGIALDYTSLMIAEPEVAPIEHRDASPDAQSERSPTPAIVVTDFAYNTQSTVQSLNSSPQAHSSTSSSPQVQGPPTQDTQYTPTSTAPLASSADRPAADQNHDSASGAVAVSKTRSPAALAPHRRSPRPAKAEAEAEAEPTPPVAENVALGKRARDDEAEGANKKVLTDGDMRKLSTPKPKLRRKN